MNHKELNHQWRSALLRFSQTELIGREGKPFFPIGQKSRAMLAGLIKESERPGAPAPVDLGALIAKDTPAKNVKFFSDIHFGHEAIIHLCGRPFANAQEMNKTIFENLEKAGALSSQMVFLGDIAMKEPLIWWRKTRSALPGALSFVGNHDAKGFEPKPWFREGASACGAFEVASSQLRHWITQDAPVDASLIDWGVFPENIRFGMCHWPMPPSFFPKGAWIQLHGHIHQRTPGPLRVNCSMENIGYEPRSLREMLRPELLFSLQERLEHEDAFLLRLKTKEEPTGSAYEKNL